MKSTFLVVVILINCVLSQSQTYYYDKVGDVMINGTIVQQKFKRNSVPLPSNIQSIEENIQILITSQDANILDIQIKPLEKTNKIYEFIELEPFTSLFNETINENVKSQNEYVYSTEIVNNGIKVTRKETNEVIFDTSLYSFLLNQVYMEVSTIMPTIYLFGLGERNYKHLRLPPGVYTLYGRDEPSVIEDGKSGGNVYSSHPMYLMKEQSGNFHVVFLKNSAGIDAEIRQNSVTFKAIGGIAHFKLFLGDKNPETAIKMYHKYLGGGYIIPPFWSLGFHQSRWGYKSGNQLNSVVDQYIQSNIPIDTIWSDIDYFKSKKTFAIDTYNYKKEDFDRLKKKQVKFIGIIDSAIGADQNIGGLANIEEYDVFCRSPTTGEYFKGNQWAGDSYFVDFFNPNSEKLFEDGIKEMEKHLLKIDGIWLDMNEPANFCHGECGWRRDSKPDKSFVAQPFRFPYVIGMRDLATKTLPPHLIHHGGYYHKDVHNIYGMAETYITYKILKKTQSQPFILTRSSFPGTGKYSFKWSGDNESNFEFLQTSLPTQILFNFFGIPMIGSDICGFMENTTPELCTRWIQLGITYPFARNHNNDKAQNQELYALGEQVKATSRKNLKFRYSILKHMYTLFVKSERVGTIQRPLFFEFPDCEQCYLDDVLDYQFMMGSELLFTPVLQKNIDSIKPLFPQGKWFDLLTGMETSSSSSNQGKRRKVYNTLDAVIPVFLRDGYGIARQETKGVVNTKQLDDNFNLIFGLREWSEDQVEKEDLSYLYSSQITMLDLGQQQYFDEQHIENVCMENKQCVFAVDLKISKDKQNNFSFKLKTSKKIKSSIYFKQITLYGAPQFIANSLQTCGINKQHVFQVVNLSTKGSYDLVFTTHVKFSDFTSENELTLCFKSV
ncbi:hypothetical protein ABPG72_008662 [Tetrahymena utriculariae]